MKPNNQLRVIGFFLLGGASIAGIMSIERYRSAVATAQHFQDRSGGVVTDLKPVTPTLTYVAGLIAIVFFAAAVQCFILSRRAHKGGPFLDADV